MFTKQRRRSIDQHPEFHRENSFRAGPPDPQNHRLRERREQRIIPWTKSPFPKKQRDLPIENQSEKGGEEKDEEEAPDAAWVEGFMDLTFVSALSSFNEEHEIGTAEQVGSYIAFFVVIWWVWASQAFYDTRYEVSDLFHRFIKFLQFAMFVAWATWGNNFDVGFGLVADNDDANEFLSQGLTISEANDFLKRGDKEARGSWEAFTVVYIISRALLMIQYAQLLVYASRAGRVTRASFVPLLASAISMTLWAIAYTATRKESHSAAVLRVALCYTGIVIEIAASFLETQINGFQSFKKTNIGERFGLLTLIILGEGVIKLTEVTRDVVTAFGFSTSIYIQILCSLMIVYLVFHIYFDGFTKQVNTGKLRNQWWAWLHFPTHLSIILVFSGIKGVLIWNNINHAAIPLLTKYTNALTDIGNGNYSLNSTQGQSLTSDLQTMGFIWPSIVEQLNQDLLAVENSTLNASLGSSSASGEDLAAGSYPTRSLWVRMPQANLNNKEADNGSSDQNIPEVLDAFAIDAFRNLAAIMNALFQTYGIEAEGETSVKYQDIMNNNTVAQSFEGVFEFTALLEQQALASSLYVSPSAGGFLVLSALVNITVEWPEDTYGWIEFGIRFVIGTVLCLFGLFDVGNQKVPYNGDDPKLIAYRWASTSWLLPSLVFAYLLCVVLEYCNLLLAHRAYRRLDNNNMGRPTLLDASVTLVPYGQASKGYPDGGAALQFYHEQGKYERESGKNKY